MIKNGVKKKKKKKKKKDKRSVLSISMQRCLKLPSDHSKNQPFATDQNQMDHSEYWTIQNATPAINVIFNLK